MRNVIGFGLVGLVTGLMVTSAACGKKSDTAAGAGADSASAAVAAPPPPVVDAAPPPAPADAAADAPMAAPPPPSPAMAASHPAYLHALTDLRIARFNLLRRGGDMAMRWNEGGAVGSIDRAIHEINMAAISDGKNINDHPPPDMTVDYRGRLHRALDALRTAQNDISKQEDNAAVQGMRGRAMRHIESAIALTEEGIAEAEHGGMRPPPPGMRPPPPGMRRPPPPVR